MRCIALGRAFSSAGWSVGFASTKETFESVHAFNGVNIDRLPIESGADEPEAIGARWPNIDVLVVDHYGKDATFERACRAFSRRIAVIDDLADRTHDCDVLVDSNAPSTDRYRKLVPVDCEILVGPKYAPLAPEFKVARPQALARRDGRPVERILVSFGQADPDNVTERALRMLMAAGFAGIVEVAIGSAAPHLGSLRRYAEQHSNVRLRVDAINMAELMTAADFAIGAGGTTSWERCCLGLPSALIEIADNQRGVIATVIETGAGFDLGSRSSIQSEQFLSVVRKALADSYGKERTYMAVNCSRLVDGLGIDRLLKVFAQ
jgi:UDP-2,4-diacetamido-2,4,6-trideoxy-beta-L-altropyranose hydrolase